MHAEREVYGFSIFAVEKPRDMWRERDNWTIDSGEGCYLRFIRGAAATGFD